MRNVFYLLAALLSLGAAWYYYGQVAAQTATVQKLRLVADDGLVIEAGTVIDDAFMDRYVISQSLPRALDAEFDWALSDTAATRINLMGQSFGQDVTGGAFLQRAHFFVPQDAAFALRIRPGNRAFSIPVVASSAVENFITPGSRVDVIGTFQADDRSIYSRVLLENVEVMAVGDIDSRGEFTSRDRPDYDSVTLQAPADLVAAYLAGAVASEGEMTLVLRNPCEVASDCAGAAQ